MCKNVRAHDNKKKFKNKIAMKTFVQQILYYGQTIVIV